MKIPLMDLRSQYRSLRNEILAVVENVFESGVYISGTEVGQFEQELAAYTQTQYAVSAANGTDALILGLHALGIGPGDEVITSPYTFFATAEAIARVGAIPVFADIDPRTYNLCPKQVEAKISKKTKAILPVHLFGHTSDMDEWMELANHHGLWIIEDGCQALGARFKGKPAGSMGHLGCFSFFPTKNLGGYGDGGAVVTQDEGIADQIRLLARHGSRRKYYHEIIGFNSRLDELQAAILRIKLRKLDEWNRARQEKASYYHQRLRDLPLILPYFGAPENHVFHLYVIQTPDRLELADHLMKAGIDTGHYYPCPLHLQKAFAHLGYRPGDLPAAERLSAQALALPLYPELTVPQMDAVISAVRQYFRR